MHVHGVSELRLAFFQRSNLDGFPRIAAGGPWRPRGRLVHHVDHTLEPGMRVLMVASEAVPFAKTGGLADVVGALPRALVGLGHDVDLVLPRYRGITAGERVTRLRVALGGQIADAEVYAANAGGVRTLFIDHPGYYDRDFLYGAAGQDYADNPERFAFLARAALEWAAVSGERYAIVHAHDWQTSLVPVLLRQALFSRHPALRDASTVLTIHNLAYQGIFDASWLPRLGFGWELMHVDAL